MKTLSGLVTCLVLSLTLAGQVMAVQSTLPIVGINTVLQMKIEQELVHSLRDDLDLQQQGQSSLPATQNRFPDNQAETYPAPDCLCQRFTRIF